jgi:glutamate/aspartate transport system substrate-binding protein
MKPTTKLKSFFLLSIATLTSSVGSLSSYAQTNDTLSKIRSSGSVTLGVRESSGALSYSIGAGQYVGFHVEICQGVVSEIKKILSLSTLDVKYVSVTPQNRIALMQNGTIDLECGSTTNNAARQKDVAFAVTTYVEEVRMAVKASSGIKSVADLNNKKVVTASGSTSVQHLRKMERATKMNIEEIFVKDHSESFLVLGSDRADAWIMDGSILASTISTSQRPADYVIVGEVINVEPIAIMLRRDDPAFKRFVDDSIKRMIQTGTLSNLWEKWFLQPIPPTNKRVGLNLNENTKAAWAQPNDKPMEDYAKK